MRCGSRAERQPRRRHHPTPPQHVPTHPGAAVGRRGRGGRPPQRCGAGWCWPGSRGCHRLPAGCGGRWWRQEGHGAQSRLLGSPCPTPDCLLHNSRCHNSNNNNSSNTPPPVGVVHYNVKHVADSQPPHRLVHIVRQAGPPLLQRSRAARLRVEGEAGRRHSAVRAPGSVTSGSRALSAAPPSLPPRDCTHPLRQHQLQELQGRGGRVAQRRPQDALAKGALRGAHQMLPQVPAHHRRKHLLAHRLRGMGGERVG